METIIRNVRDLASDERRFYEQTLGHSLADDQQIIIQVTSAVTAGSLPPDDRVQVGGVGALPAWCNVFEGLSDDEIAEVERIALQRSDMSRPSP